MKIIKTSPRTWSGTGFGSKSATYAVAGREDIRIVRASHGWTAYLGTIKYFGATKAELEQELSK